VFEVLVESLEVVVALDAGDHLHDAADVTVEDLRLLQALQGDQTLVRSRPERPPAGHTGHLARGLGAAQHGHQLLVTEHGVIIIIGEDSLGSVRVRGEGGTPAVAGVVVVTLPHCMQPPTQLLPAAWQCRVGLVVVNSRQLRVSVIMGKLGGAGDRSQVADGALDRLPLGFS
jgi:hypothetical protein